MTVFGDMVDALLFIRAQQGWHQALDIAWQFIREPFYEHHDGYVLRKSLDEPVEVPIADVDLEIRQIGLDEITILNTIMPNMRVKRIARKIRAGEICNTAIKNGKVIGFVLAGFTNTPSTRQVHLKLDSDEAYLWSGFALPEFRRQKVVKVVNLDLCRLLQEKGYKKVVLLVEMSNQASLGHCFKMGYHVTDRIVYSRIFNWATCQIIPTKVDEDQLISQTPI